jgi:hypothetical protein
MTSAPALIPVTIPLDTVAVVLLALQTPAPPVTSDSVMKEPAHTAEAPVITPALGALVTVTVWLTTVVTQPLVTE